MAQPHILYQDSHVIVIEKPVGVLSHPNPGAKRERCAFPGRYDVADRRFDSPGGSIWLLHRLDKDTSGALLAARSRDARDRLLEQFNQHTMKKRYLALVKGRPGKRSDSWHDQIVTTRKGNAARSTAKHASRWNAKLRYSMAEYFPTYDLTLLNVLLLTGKTHQVRVQCASRGFPIAGDRLYGDFAFNKECRKRVGLKRLFLHAVSLDFVHPGNGRPIHVVAPLPADLEHVLDTLRQQGYSY